MNIGYSGSLALRLIKTIVILRSFLGFNILNPKENHLQNPKLFVSDLNNTLTISYFP